MSILAVQLLKNAVTGWVSILIRSGLAFYIVPFLIRELGRDGFGLVGLLTVLLGLSRAADLGLGSALGRELAEQSTRKEWGAYNEFASTAFLLYLGIAGCMGALCFYFAPHFCGFFRVPEVYFEKAVWAVRVYGSGAFLIAFVQAVYMAALTSQGRFDISNNIQSAGSILAGVAMITVMSRYGGGLYTWVAVMLADQALVLALFMISARKACPWFRLRPRFVRLSRVKALLSLGSQVYLVQITNLISEKSDPLVVSRFFGTIGVSTYNAGSRISRIVRPIVLTLSTQLHPFATRQHVRSESEKQRLMLTQGTKYTLLLGAASFAGLFVFAEPFCAVWLQGVLGEDYRVAAQVIRLWAVVDFLVCCASIQWPILLGMRRLKFVVLAQSALAFANIGLSIYLTGYTNIGLTGVLWGTILTALIRRPLLIWYGARVCGLPLWRFIREALMRPFLVTGLLTAAAEGARRLVDPVGYGALLMCGAGLGLVWAALVWGVGLNASDRQRVREVSRGAMRRRRGASDREKAG